MTKIYPTTIAVTEFNHREEATIQEAIGLLETKLRYEVVFTSPDSVKHYCQLNIACETDEYFCCLFLDNQHRLISFERLFRGTIDGASVHPRVVARLVLELNAAAVIFTHNHPSGFVEPSQADIRITQKLKEALCVFDIRVLDHVIVGYGSAYSMAETGEI